MLIFSWYSKFIHFFFDKVWVDCNWKHLQKVISFERKRKFNLVLNFDLTLGSFRVKYTEIVNWRVVVRDRLNLPKISCVYLVNYTYVIAFCLYSRLLHCRFKKWNLNMKPLPETKLMVLFPNCCLIFSKPWKEFPSPLLSLPSDILALTGTSFVHE